MACRYRELFTLTDMINILGNTVGMPVRNSAINVSMHKVRAGALVLAETLTPQSTPFSKHYITKNIWFHDDIFNRGIKLFKY